MDGENKLGYLYKGKLQDMANDYIKNGLPIFAAISTISIDDEDISKSNLSMFLAFYYLKNYKNSTSFKLSGNANSDMQDMLLFSSVGDEVTFSYDYKKEKFLAECGGEIGCAPKGKNDLLESLEEYYATIEELDMDDSGKYYAVVKLMY